MSQPESTPVVEQPASRGLLLAALSLVWMAGTLFSARITITGGPDPEMEVTSTAYALPGAVSASLVTGIAVALAVLGLVAQRRTLGATARFAIATGSGLAIGLLGALVVVTINTEGWLYAVVGGTIAAASTIGGALGGFRVPRVLAALCWGSIAVFLVGFVLNIFQNPVLDALGSGSSERSQTSAAQWFSFAQSVLSGIAAGIVAHRLLRRARRRADGADVSPVFYFVAGGGPGLLLLVGEALTRSAGSRVLDLAGKVSVLELTVQKLLSGARFNSALIVLFAGAISAAVAFGLGIKPATEDDLDAEGGAVDDAKTWGRPGDNDTAADDARDNGGNDAKTWGKGSDDPKDWGKAGDDASDDVEAQDDAAAGAREDAGAGAGARGKARDTAKAGNDDGAGVGSGQATSEHAG